MPAATASLKNASIVPTKSLTNSTMKMSASISIGPTTTNVVNTNRKAFTSLVTPNTCKPLLATTQPLTTVPALPTCHPQVMVGIVAETPDCSNAGQKNKISEMNKV